MRDPLPPVEETGLDGDVITFRHGIPFPATATDCKGTVTIREEVRTPIESPWRYDKLGNKNSMVVPATRGHVPDLVLPHDPPRDPTPVPPSTDGEPSPVPPYPAEDEPPPSGTDT